MVNFVERARASASRNERLSGLGVILNGQAIDEVHADRHLHSGNAATTLGVDEQLPSSKHQWSGTAVPFANWSK